MVVAAGIGSLGPLACKRDEPAPTKVSEREPLIQPPTKPKRTGPFTDPNVDPPGPRETGQLDGEELQRSIAKARARIEAGELIVGMQILRRCANKTPQSVPCEAELGMALAKAKKYKAHARYFMAEAAKVDDPQTPTDTYRKLAAAASDFAQYATTATALGVVVNRGEATSEDYAALAVALQADPSRTGEAIDAYARAYELDPKGYEYLREQATLLAQVQEHEKAIELFKAYKEKVGAHSPLVPAVDARIRDLEARVAAQAQTSPAGKNPKKASAGAPPTPG